MNRLGIVKDGNYFFYLVLRVNGGDRGSGMVIIAVTMNCRSRFFKTCMVIAK